MIRRPPRSTRTDTLFPYTTLFRSRPAHVARLLALQDAGRLVLAGPRPNIDAADPGEAGFSGSLVVAEFESLAAAQAWAGDDPYVSSEERRGGKEGVSTGRSRWSPYT